MEIGQEKQGGVLILEPVGRLDTGSSQEFQQQVVKLVDAGERRVVIDLKKTVEMSAAGLRALFMLSKKLESMGGGLILCSMSEQVRKAFDVAGVIQMVSIAVEPTRGDAVKRLSADEAVAKVADLAAKLLAKKDGPPDGH
ncbi:MAG TPA: STAS domain-containing protein [Thermoanaerobaculaceae bacterium]|nr:STAS domain-containing protein [Thermoanaerobaculaceae bacterium]